MPKTTDVPHELRDFNNVFEMISRRWDYSRVFDDFLTITLNFFRPLPQKLERPNYERDDLDRFNELLRLFFVAMQGGIEKHGWYDALGIYYQVLSSRSKKSCMGQFFTPVALCDMTARMNITKGDTGKIVNDPACGSGRMLLASHVYNLGNFHFGEDLDPVCCKMTAINFVIHGVQGEVVNMNSLSRESYRFGFCINRWLQLTGVPLIEDMPASQSFVWAGYDSWRVSKIKQKEVRLGQLSLAI